MSIEDDLFGLFKSVNFTGMPTGDIDVASMLASVLDNVEAGMLRKLRSHLDRLIVVKEKQTKEAWDTEGRFYGSKHDGDKKTKQKSSQKPKYDASLDPFKILGVSMTASEEEVNAAYKSKAKAAHPDHGGSNEDMVKINAAFEVICTFKGWKK